MIIANVSTRNPTTQISCFEQTCCLHLQDTTRPHSLNINRNLWQINGLTQEVKSFLNYLLDNSSNCNTNNNHKAGNKNKKKPVTLGNCYILFVVLSKGNIYGDVVPVLNSAPSHDDKWGRAGIAPTILNLSTRYW